LKCTERRKDIREWRVERTEVMELFLRGRKGRIYMVRRTKMA
jgi:hypothetical protein